MARTNDILQRVLGHQFSGQRYTTVALKEINNAHKWVLRQGEFRTTSGGFTSYDFSTTASVAEYALPTDFIELAYLVDITNDNDKIEKISVEEYEELPADSGVPDLYTIINDKLRFYPTPLSVIEYRLRYRSGPSTLTIEDDPVTPEEYDDIIVDYVLWRLYAMEHDFEAANWHKSERDMGILNMRTELNMDAQEYPDIIPGTWG